MSEEVKVEVQEKSTHGAPNPPPAAPTNKDEHEAALKNEGKEETFVDPKASDKKPEEKKEKVPEHKTYTQEELDAAIEASKQKSQEEWSGEYVNLEHEAGQAVIDLLKESEVSPVEANAIFEEAIKSGDLSKIKWDILEKKLGPAKAKLAKAGIYSYHTEVYTKQQETVQKVYDEVDGEKNWVTIRDWAQDKEKTDAAFAKQVREYRKALDAGGFAALAAVRELKQAYTNDPGTKGLDNKQLQHGTKQPAPVGGPLSKAEYLKLRREAEYGRATEQDIAVLVARRKAGMQAGI